MRRTVLLLVVLALLLAAVAAGAWVLLRDDGGTSVKGGQAADVSRDTFADSTSTDTQAERTFTYRGSGTSAIDALGGQKHEFPAEAPVVVEGEAGTSGDCERTESMVFLEEQVERTTRCPRPDQILLTRQETSLTFLGSTDETDLECTDGSDGPGILAKAGAAAGASTSVTCTGDDSKVVYETSVLGADAIEIGGEQVDAVHVRLKGTWSGDDTGSELVDLWFGQRGGQFLDLPPLRRVTNNRVVSESVLGATTYTERTDFRLATLQPKD